MTYPSLRLLTVAAATTLACMSVGGAPAFAGPTDPGPRATLDTAATVTTVDSSDDTVTIVTPSTVTGGQDITIRGTGWTANDPDSGARLIVKLHHLDANGRDAQYERTTGILEHPLKHFPDPTIWAMVEAQPTGEFELHTTLPEGLVAGQNLSIQVSSGNAGLAPQRSVKVITPVDGVPWVDPDAGNTITCVPSTVPPTVTVPDTPTEDGILHISGTGFCNSISGGSTIAVKIDDGAIHHVAGHTVHSNASIWQIIDADPATGDFSADVHIPNGTDQGPLGSTPLFTPGNHVLRILTGTLKDGDPIRSFPLDANHNQFVVGAYKPSGAPAPVDYTTELNDNTRYGVHWQRRNNTLRVTIPGAAEGDWFYASVYLKDSSPRLVWGDLWLQSDKHGVIELPDAPGRIPLGASKLVIQSGNKGVVSTLMGWAPITSDAPHPTPPEVANPAPTVVDTAPVDTVRPTPTTTAVAAQKTPTRTEGQAWESVAASLVRLQENLFLTMDFLGLLPQSTTPTTTTTPAAVPADGGVQATDEPVAAIAAAPRNVVTIIRTVVTVRSTPASGRTTATVQPQPTHDPEKLPTPGMIVHQPRNDVSATATTSDDATMHTVVVTLPGVDPGTWVYPVLYTPQRTPAGWARVDDDHQIRLEMHGTLSGLAAVAIVDDEGRVVGWSPITGLPPAPAPAQPQPVAPQQIVAAPPQAPTIPFGLADGALIAGGVAASVLMVGGARRHTRRREATTS